MTALVDTLFQLEKYLGLELDSLLPYAEMDDLGGYHPNPEQRKWGSGAIWEVEGQTLYALIRALRPKTIVEIGSGTGCSTTHIISALKANSVDRKTTGIGGGHITTIDRGNTPSVPDDSRDYVTILSGDAIDYLALLPDNSIDFLFEDADHSEAMCYQVGELAKTKLRPGGVLMVHDAVHPTVGADIRAGYDRAGLDVRTYLTDPSDCGWAVWRRPALPEGARLMPDGSVVREYNQTEQDHIHLQNSLADTEPVLQAQEDQRPVKAKRTRKAKK